MIRQNKSGFTLVELLAVLVILAIILAITIPGISSVITNVTKAAFESDAKLVLQQVEYKKLENPNFDPSDINKSNFRDLLGLSDENYETISITIEDDTPIINIVGTNKWDGWIACGTFTNMKVVQDQSDCGTDLIPPVITLIGGNTISIVLGESYVDAGATASDNIDGDITGNIVKSGEVNTNALGSYEITYDVSDSAGNAATTVTRTVIVGENLGGPGYIASKGVNGPVLATNMIPIKWVTDHWETTTKADDDWYSYTTTDKQWANAIQVSNPSKYTVPGTTVDVANDVVAMWVWIPRYVYNISVGWNQKMTSTTAGTIQVQFSMNTDDTRGGTVTIVNTGNASDSNGTWTNHPAFKFGSTEVTGIWVAKFEATAAEGLAQNAAGDNVTTKTVKIVPNVSSWSRIQVSNIFTVTRKMETDDYYGWGTSGNGIDTHMAKNTEWGAVAYLSQSTYGKNAEITRNGTLYTGGGIGDAYITNVGQSTTGNIYGIYDMNGRGYEYTAAYVNNSYADDYGSSITSLTGDNVKYKDVYNVGTSDTTNANYAAATNHKGDALYETCGVNDDRNWYNDTCSMPDTYYPWFIRGGGALGYPDTVAGLFAFGGYTGEAPGDENGFRPILIVHAGI